LVNEGEIMMLSDLPLFQVYGAMARHAADTQRVSAANIAHANEAGYKAKALESFQDFMARQHQGVSTAGGFRVSDADTPAAPNGNTVSLEQEALRSAEAMGQHSLALTVYAKSVDLMRTAIGRRG
jgi:flagellar basal-body rod protein FlgB